MLEFLIICVGVWICFMLVINWIGNELKEIKNRINAIDDRQRSDNENRYIDYFDLNGKFNNHSHKKVMEEVPSKVVEMKEVDRVVW